MLTPTTATAPDASRCRQQLLGAGNADHHEGEFAGLRQQQSDFGGNCTRRTETARRGVKDHRLAGQAAQ